MIVRSLIAGAAVWDIAPEINIRIIVPVMQAYVRQHSFVTSPFFLLVAATRPSLIN
jgi:hypothetical protein